MFETAPSNESKAKPEPQPTQLRQHAPALECRPAPIKRRYADLLALDDFKRHARRRLPAMIFQYVAGAVEKGASMQASFDAFASHKLRPRMFRDVSGRNQSVELFGKRWSSPFGVAPLGGAAFVAYRADLQLARAARLQGIPMILSASSLIRLEDVVAENHDVWFQAYLAGDQPRIDRLVDRVAAAGIVTLVVTGDTPVLGNREHNVRSGFSMPISVTPKVALECAMSPRWMLGVVARTFLKHGAPHFENTDAERGPPMMSRRKRNTHARDQLSWEHIKAIRRRWKGNLVVKGITSPADVGIAQELGVDAVMLSNHGGRQLDCAVSPMDTLAEVVSQKGDMKIIVDGAIRRGTDVIKAFALGADFVFLGRPFLYAVTVDGSDGVEHATSVLRIEIDRDMALVGVEDLTALTPDYVTHYIPTGDT